MPRMPYRLKYVDGERAFRLMWIERKSCREVCLLLAQEGKYNRETGKPVTPSAVNTSAWRWMFAHLPEAREAIRKLYLDWGDPMTEEDIDRMLTIRAKQAFTKVGYKRFIAANGWEKYLV
uniref:Uncharacterized protein n=1 Tax=viral metagenome TaxID=1070528 RepID=A0A6H1Z9H3_9ZZZZ